MNQLTIIKKTLKANKKRLEKDFRVVEIAIFGSFVRGEQKRGGDLDILVEFDDAPDLLTFIKLERELEKVLGQKIDLVRKKSLREELREGILSEMVEV